MPLCFGLALSPKLKLTYLYLILNTVLLFACRPNSMLQPEHCSPNQLISSEHTRLTHAIALLVRIARIDSHALREFTASPVPDPQHAFLRIVKAPLPPQKQPQCDIVEALTYCLYAILNEQQLPNIESIEAIFLEVLRRAHYIPQSVLLYQRIREWARKLTQGRDAVSGRNQIKRLRNDLRNQPAYGVLKWKSELCALVLDVLCGAEIKRADAVGVLRVYHTAKKHYLFDLQTSAQAFIYLTQQLLLVKSELYTFFEKELLHIKRFARNIQLVQNINKVLEQCQQYLSQTLHSVPVLKAPNQRPTRPTGTVLKRNQVDPIFRRVDHFLKTRPQVRIRSNSKERKSDTRLLRKPSHNSEQRSTSGRSLVHVMSLHASRLDWVSSPRERSSHRGRKVTARLSLNKTRDAYARIKEHENKNRPIRQTDLLNEMFTINQIAEERCRITFDEIMLGLANRKARDDSSAKFIGADEQLEFGELSLCFYTIFNQQLASLAMQLTKCPRGEYQISCWVRSTYSPNPVGLEVAPGRKAAMLDEFFEYLSKSTIYYEAIQERVERKMGVGELQANEEVFREQMGLPLSQGQLVRILQAVDMAFSEFFWYYTKSTYLTGSRVEKRSTIEFEDLSAFAVSLGKFKSDYDSCLCEIVQVENSYSLLETCVYLAHGRALVYTAFRHYCGELMLQTITVDPRVYHSFRRDPNKKPYFGCTVLRRKMYGIAKFNPVDSLETRIDLREVLPLEDVFIFFMKNIVENFYQRKYLDRLESYLEGLSQNENRSFEQERRVRASEQYNIEVVGDEETETNDYVEVQPSLHTSIAMVGWLVFEYVQIYGLDAHLRVAQQRRYVFKLGGRRFWGEEAFLSNGLGVVKVYKVECQTTYQLFMYHQNFGGEGLGVVRTPWRDRVGFTSQRCVNLIRLRQEQTTVGEYQHIHRSVLRDKKGYYLVVGHSFGDGFRLYVYHPQTQAVLSTFLNHPTPIDSQQWQIIMENLAFNPKKYTISLFSFSYRLFQSYRSMQLPTGSIELIELQGQLCYLIIGPRWQLRVGKVEEMPSVNNNTIFSTLPTNRLRISVYNNLMVRLFKKMQSGRICSQALGVDSFQLQ